MGRWRAALKWVGHKKDAKSPKGGWSRTQGGGEGHRWAGMTAGGHGDDYRWAGRAAKELIQ